MLMRDVVLFSLTGSAAKNCLCEEGVPCDVLSRGSETRAAGTREKAAESEADGRDVRRQSGLFSCESSSVPSAYAMKADFTAYWLLRE